MFDQVIVAVVYMGYRINSYKKFKQKNKESTLVNNNCLIISDSHLSTGEIKKQWTKVIFQHNALGQEALKSMAARTNIFIFQLTNHKQV